jgi:hypothetical protein
VVSTYPYSVSLLNHTLVRLRPTRASIVFYYYYIFTTVTARAVLIEVTAIRCFLFGSRASRG